MDSGAPQDPPSVQALYRQYRAELCRFLMHKHRLSSSEAEDVVQTAFSRLAAGDTAALDNPRAFLYRMVVNLVIDQQRHNQVQDRYLQSQTDDEAAAPGPERTLAGQQRLGIIARAVWGMPKKRRQLLLMSRFDGLSFAEIARQVGLSETVVRKHINKALAECHNALAARGAAHEVEH